MTPAVFKIASGASRNRAVTCAGGCLPGSLPAGYPAHTPRLAAGERARRSKTKAPGGGDVTLGNALAVDLGPEPGAEH